MPLFHFYCDECSQEIKRILSVEELVNPVACPICQGPTYRKARGPTSQVTEILDNGLMGRKVERLKDAERLYKERSKNHKP